VELCPQYGPIIRSKHIQFRVSSQRIGVVVQMQFGKLLIKAENQHSEKDSDPKGPLPR
jgi:hypothetical protein